MVNISKVNTPQKNHHDLEEGNDQRESLRTKSVTNRPRRHRYPSCSRIHISHFSIYSSSDDGENDGHNDSKLHRIQSVVQEIADQCGPCWVERRTSRAHYTYRCHTKITPEKGLQGTVRYLAPYAPPFNHAPPPNEKPSASLCDYPDVTKGTRVHPLSRRVVTKQSFRNLVHTTLSMLMRRERCSSGCGG